MLMESVARCNLRTKIAQTHLGRIKHIRIFVLLQEFGGLLGVIGMVEFVFVDH